MADRIYSRTFLFGRSNTAVELRCYVRKGSLREVMHGAAEAVAFMKAAGVGAVRVRDLSMESNLHGIFFYTWAYLPDGSEATVRETWDRLESLGWKKGRGT